MSLALALMLVFAVMYGWCSLPEWVQRDLKHRATPMVYWTVNAAFVTFLIFLASSVFNHGPIDTVGALLSALSDGGGGNARW